jgi:hypothetical protein
MSATLAGTSVVHSSRPRIVEMKNISIEILSIENIFFLLGCQYLENIKLKKNINISEKI